MSVCQTENGWQYTVVDDGSGISEEQLRHLNAGIFQKSNYKSDGETVHGFGLRLVWQIVKAHGGSIMFEHTLFGGLSIVIVFPF